MFGSKNNSNIILFNFRIIYNLITQKQLINKLLENLKNPLLNTN